MTPKKSLAGIALLAMVTLIILQPSQAIAQYRGKNLYFSGESVSSGETPSGAWVSRINAADRPYYPTTNGVRESGVYPLGGYEDIDPYGSSGYVMPNKQNNGSSALGVSSGGGAIGTRALYNMSEAEKTGGTAADNAARKQKLFNLLKSKNQSGSTWEKMGSAHIVHQMLGHKPSWESGGKSGRAITAAEWAELERRLVDNPKIWMIYMPGQSVAKNTAGMQLGSGVNPRIDVIDDSNQYLGAVWAFREGASPTSSTNVYMLEVICANPVGDLGGLPDVKYSLTPELTSPKQNAVVTPSTVVTANGSVTNGGPDSAGTKTWYITRLRYDSSVNPNKSARDSNNNPNDLCKEFTGSNQCDDSDPKEQTFSNGQERTGSFVYKIPDGATPGTKYCFVVSVRQPTQNTTNPVWRHSAMRCVVVASTADFDLIPKVDDSERSDGSAIEPGDSIDVKHNVTNDGEDPSPKTIWQLTKLIYSPTAVFDTTPNNTTKKARDGNNNGDTACSMFMSANRDECEKVQETTEAVFNSGEPKTFDPVFGYTIPEDALIGTRICFVSSVSKPTPAASPIWRHSAMWCLMVGKKPKLQVWGGDVRSGGKINTSTSGFSGKTFGSWVEYGALSVGENKGFASGAALNKGSAMPGQALWSKLTFANTGGTFGVYTPSLPFSSLASQFIAPGSGGLSGSHNLNDLASNRTPYKAGAITLSGTTISRGKTIIIDADTVTIQGDIAYEDVDYTNIRDLPQVIIKAKKINIESGVRRVDAWLLAISDDEKGELNTCSNHTGNLTASSCSNQLTINGPVVADIVYLRRTGGSENTLEARGEPAEIFNLRADAYMWANAYGLGTGRVQTVYSRELAPRL